MDTTERHDKIEMLLKVALNTITLTLSPLIFYEKHVCLIWQVLRDLNFQPIE